MSPHEATARLPDVSAIVTGTSPNIGGGIAIGLAAAGARVTCIDLNQANAEACAADIVERGGVALGLGCDVTNEDQVADVIERARAAHGPTTTLVNAAVLYNEKGILEMPLAEYRRQLDVILSGAFLCTREVLRQMIEHEVRGSITNITSSAAYQGEPGNIAYATAKSGLLNFTRSVAMEVAHLGIRVNSLAPTSTDPEQSWEREARWGRPSTNSVEAREFFAAVARRVPLQHLPGPSDYAAAAVFLASQDAKMITGTDLRVDAGTIARYWRWDPGREHRLKAEGTDR